MALLLTIDLGIFWYPVSASLAYSGGLSLLYLYTLKYIVCLLDITPLNPIRNPCVFSGQFQTCQLLDSLLSPLLLPNEDTYA